MDAKADDNGIGRVLRLEYVLDLSFNLEEVVLAQIDFLKLKLDGLLDDRAQVLVHLRVLPLVVFVVFYVAPGLNHLQLDLWFSL